MGEATLTAKAFIARTNQIKTLVSLKGLAIDLKSLEQQVIFLDDLVDNVENARANGWQAHHVESCDHAVEILNGL